MAGQRDTARYASDGTALVVTGAAAAVLLLSSRHFLDDMPRAHTARSDLSIELSLQAPEAAPTPPPPQPPPPKTRHTRQIATPAPVPVPADPLPVAQEPAPPDAALFAAPVPAPAAAGESHPDLDAQYAAELRADIDRRTHPPQSAQYRLHHPSGEVRVRFVVTRSGEVKAVTLLRSSGSGILDEAALGIVSSGHYPPMPAQAFMGEAKHTFVVAIEFRAASVARRTRATASAAA